MEGQLGSWLISLFFGVVGGHIGGVLMKNYSLSRAGNTLTGALGGLGGQFLMSRLGGGASTGLWGIVIGAAVGGALLMIVVALFFAATD